MIDWHFRRRDEAFSPGGICLCLVAGCARSPISQFPQRVVYMISFFRSLVGIAVLLATAPSGFGQPISPPLPPPLGSSAQGGGQENWAREKGDTLIPSCRFERARCGYIDRAGKTVIAPQFDWVERFAAGRALVGRDGKYGAIDETGKLVIPLIYDNMSKFDRGLAVVLVGDRQGVIDQNGQWVVSAEHGMIVRFSGQAFLVEEPPYPLAHYTRRQIEGLSNPPVVLAKGKWGIVASGGAPGLVRPKFAQVAVFTDDFDDLFWAADSKSSSALWQLMRIDGTAANDHLFDHVQKIQSGQDRAIVVRDNRWGAVNGKGEIAVELKFD